jgi:hypothetical protein
MHSIPYGSEDSDGPKDASIEAQLVAASANKQEADGTSRVEIMENDKDAGAWI